MLFALGVIRLRETPVLAATVRFTIAPPPGIGVNGRPELSPDGRRLVFSGSDSNLWLRALNALKVARESGNYPRAERLGTLVASGLIVGESLFGVLNAGLIVAFNNDVPLVLVPEEFAPARALGVIAFAALVVWLYAWLARHARYRAFGR